MTPRNKRQKLLEEAAQKTPPISRFFKSPAATVQVSDEEQENTPPRIPPTPFAVIGGIAVIPEAAPVVTPARDNPAQIALTPSESLSSYSRCSSSMSQYFSPAHKITQTQLDELIQHYKQKTLGYTVEEIQDMRTDAHGHTYQTLLLASLLRKAKYNADVSTLTLQNLPHNCDFSGVNLIGATLYPITSSGSLHWDFSRIRPGEIKGLDLTKLCDSITLITSGFNSTIRRADGTTSLKAIIIDDAMRIANELRIHPDQVALLRAQKAGELPYQLRL